MTSLDWRAARGVLVAGAAILAVSLSIRHSFGLFLDPVSTANGWGRETFALAIALQNLVWGAAQPFAGMAADRWGAGRVILAGAVFYVAGLILMAQPLGATGFVLAAGILVGLGLAGTTFPIVFGAVTRALPPERRSLALGITTAIGSLGMFLLLPTSVRLIDGISWASTLLVFSALAALIVPLAFFMMERRNGTGAVVSGPTAREALRIARSDRGFWLLGLGFFVCGFQVVFITVHLPAFLSDRQLPQEVSATVLALVGLFNVFGTLAAGWLGSRIPKPALLVGIYFARAVVIAAFILLPVTSFTAYAFGILMGFLWLSTVPLTNGTVATMFGVKNLSMLGGIVFFSHQVGSFLGGWLGGVLYDRFGSYDIVWVLTIALSVIAGLLNIPVRERPVVARRAEATA